MYTIILDEGIVIRDDGKVVAPCQSIKDIDFIEYSTWVEEGNEPVVLDTRG